MKYNFAKLAAAAALILGVVSCGWLDNESYVSGGGEIDPGVKNFDITWPNGEVEIGYYEGKTVMFYEEPSTGYSYDETMCYYYNGYTLYIKSTRRYSSNAPSKLLRVLLPMNSVYRDLDLDVRTANCYVDIDCQDEVKIDATSGMVQFSTLVAPRDEVKIETTSGNVTIKHNPRLSFYLYYSTFSGTMMNVYPVTGSNGNYEFSGVDPIHIPYKVTTVSGNLDFVEAN